MKSQYNKIVSLICGENWETDEVPVDERDGGYGVAMCIAYLQGCSYRLFDLSDFLGVPPQNLEVAYKRLQINGLFSDDCPLLDKDELLMSNAKTEEEITACKKAWCNIAALASAFKGKARMRNEMASK